MNRAFNWIGQALLYSCFALAIGVFSRWPMYHPLKPDHALIKVSFVHHGVRVADCRPYTKEELAKLAPNMRAPMKCERERSPVQIELDIDGKTVYQKTAYPSGLSRYVASTVYQSFDVPAGARRIAVRLKDNQTIEGFNYQHDSTITLKPAQVLVIDFNAEQGGIILS